MNDRHRSASTIGLCVLIGAAGGCTGTATTTTVAPLTPAATIVVDGSSTVYRISFAARTAYAKVNPGVVVVVDNHGTGGGFSRYLEGEVDIVDASRAAKSEEEARAKAQGIDWSRFLVGYDGITLVVNPKNDFVKSVSVEQLKSVWASGSKVTTWKDIDPAWPDRKIIFYSPDNDSGTFEFFLEAIVGKGGSQRDDVQQNSDDNTLVIGVANDPDGIGYFGYAYYAANQDKLRPLAVQNGKDAKPVLPSPETIIDKSYAPLSRPLFIYVKNSAARRPEVSQFLKYYLDNVDEFAVKGGYAQPTAEDKTANQTTFAKLVPGAGAEAATKEPVPASDAAPK
jgi:phosphate transport system substrate-binding protein